jgi:hypothetical protein
VHSKSTEEREREREREKERKRVREFVTERAPPRARERWCFQLKHTRKRMHVNVYAQTTSLLG